MLNPGLGRKGLKFGISSMRTDLRRSMTAHSAYKLPNNMKHMSRNIQQQPRFNLKKTMFEIDLSTLFKVSYQKMISEQTSSIFAPIGGSTPILSNVVAKKTTKPYYNVAGRRTISFGSSGQFSRKPTYVKTATNLGRPTNWSSFSST